MKITFLKSNSNLQGADELTHLPKCHMYAAVNQVSIGSNNGLSPIQCQAIIWTNAGLLSIGPLGTNFSAILIKTQNFSFTKMHLKISSAKSRPFCAGGDELMVNQGCEKSYLELLRICLSGMQHHWSNLFTVLSRTMNSTAIEQVCEKEIQNQMWKWLKKKVWK